MTRLQISFGKTKTMTNVKEAPTTKIGKGKINSQELRVLTGIKMVKMDQDGQKKKL